MAEPRLYQKMLFVLPMLLVLAICALWMAGVFRADNKQIGESQEEQAKHPEQEQRINDNTSHSPASSTSLSQGSPSGTSRQKAFDPSTLKTLSPRDYSRPPKEFGDFFSLSSIRQAKLVTEAMHNPSLSNETKQFFLNALKDNRLSRLVRNNMAEALKNQEDKDPELYRAFLEIIDDENQNKDWRLYSIQHLAAVHRWSDGKEEIENKLFDLLDGEQEEFSSQAMLMIDDLATAGQMELRQGFLDAIEKNLSSASSTPTRISAMTLLGRDYAAEKIEIVREYASTPSPIQRVAIANLGLIGNSSDLKLISSFLNDSDSRVVMAAKKAIERLKEKGGS